LGICSGKFRKSVVTQSCEIGKDVFTPFEKWGWGGESQNIFKLLKETPKSPEGDFKDGIFSV
jgi:hypothetical protein